MRLPTVLLFLAVLIPLGGCDAFTSERAELRLVLNQPQYRAGQQTLAVLDNNAEHAFSYSSCGPQLEHREGHAWVPVETAAQVCTADLRKVGPGQAVTFRHDLPEALPAGTYRLSLPVGRDERQRDHVTSEAFRVTG